METGMGNEGQGGETPTGLAKRARSRFEFVFLFYIFQSRKRWSHGAERRKRTREDIAAPLTVH